MERVYPRVEKVIGILLSSMPVFLPNTSAILPPGMLIIIATMFAMVPSSPHWVVFSPISSTA